MLRYVESFDGTAIAYRSVGTGPTVVLLPGINFSGRIWDRQVAALAGEMRMVLVDPRGHGDSDKPVGDYSYAAHAKDVAAVVDGLGLEDVTLVGWSLGGGIAARYASDSPRALKRLVLVAAAVPRFTSAPDFEHGLPEDAVRGLLERERTDRPAYRRWATEQSFGAAELDADTLDWLWSISMMTPSWASLACLEALASEDLREALPRVSVPTLLIQGANDAFVPAASTAAAAEAIPDSRVMEFPNSSHGPFLEEPDRFTEVLRQFVLGS